MTGPAQIDPQSFLGTLAGTYLRNVWRSAGACRLCGGSANPGFETCYTCSCYAPGDQPSAAGFLAYGANGTTAGTLMYGYKDPAATIDQQAIVKLLAARGFAHARCAERLVGSRVTHCATVPSTKARPDGHPLEHMVRPFLPWPLHPMRHNPEVAAVRQRVQPDLFVAAERLPADSHVLLIEDTWTSGNKPLSAVAALRAAGAGHVSLLCLARWLSFDFMVRPPGPAPTGLPATILEQTVFDLSICPFTGSACP